MRISNGLVRNLRLRRHVMLIKSRQPAYRPDSQETPIEFRRAHMKSLLIAAAAVAFMAVANPSSASAAKLLAPTPGQVFSQSTRAPHYEWQYHYVGRHARYEGQWVLVR